MDRRAPHGGMGDHRLAGGVHGSRGGADEVHQPRHRGHKPAVPSSAHGGEPHGAARPPDEGARDARRGARGADYGRLHAGDRPAHAAQPHGGVVRHHHAAADGEGADNVRVGLVHAERGSSAPPAVYEAAFPGGGRRGDVAVGHGACRASRRVGALDCRSDGYEAARRAEPQRLLVHRRGDGGTSRQDDGPERVEARYSRISGRLEEGGGGAGARRVRQVPAALFRDRDGPRAALRRPGGGDNRRGYRVGAMGRRDAGRPDRGNPPARRGERRVRRDSLRGDGVGQPGAGDEEL